MVTLKILDATTLNGVPTTVVLRGDPEVQQWTLVVDGVPTFLTTDPVVAVALYDGVRARLPRGRQ